MLANTIDPQLHVTELVLLQRRYILDRVSPEPNTGCWLWTGSIGSAGYGRILKSELFDLASGAHRWAYKAFIGPVKDYHEIDHLCCCPTCVNPAHLEPVIPFIHRARTAERRRTKVGGKRDWLKGYEPRKGGSR
jgi:hypothetical protein